MHLVFVFLKMQFDDLYFMKQAILEAKKALHEDEVPIGAIVVVGNQIIARAHNLTERLNDVTAHAEMQAITSAANFINGKYLVGCTLYVTLEPCIMCAGAINWSQLEGVVYAASDFKRGFIQAGLSLHPKTVIRGGIMQKESKDLLDKFFAKKRS